MDQKTNQTTYATARWIFLRGLGIVYLIAFVSLWVQIDGLLGSLGILPAHEFLTAVRERLGAASYWTVPSLYWLHPSDVMLHGLCAAGAALSAALIFDLAPALALTGLWLTYLSLASIGQDFLSFQWDALLLETGFLAIFFAPLRVLPRGEPPPPSRISIWLFRWLLFRLVFSSGFVKLLSGDPTWRNLTALLYHYETQPLPTWIGWYAHQLPAWFQRASCAIMFVIELAVPWLIFGPRLARRAACAILIGLQLLIAATGNYCFFNLLTVLLCLLLLDDQVWPTAWRRTCLPDTPVGRRWPTWILAILAVLIIPLSLLGIGGRWIMGGRWMMPFLMVSQLFGPFRTVNGYGLFAVMTTERQEIVIEGSRDGQTWEPYEFTYKPGDLRRRPRFVAPHQPRLDWQMWFEGLNAERNMKASDDPATYRYNIWFRNFVIRLLQGSADVLLLLDRNPFPDAPPKYIRAVVYNYHFTNFAERKETGNWWKREYKGVYLSPTALE